MEDGNECVECHKRKYIGPCAKHIESAYQELKIENEKLKGLLIKSISITTHDLIVKAFKEQLAEVTKERDELKEQAEYAVSEMNRVRDLARNHINEKLGLRKTIEESKERETKLRTALEKIENVPCTQDHCSIAARAIAKAALSERAKDEEVK